MQPPKIFHLDKLTKSDIRKLCDRLKPEVMPIACPKIELMGVEGFVSVVKPNGEETQRQDFKNLLLDQGLDQVGTNKLCNLTRYLAYGDGTNPTERDSSTTTASRTGSAVSASAGFFELADVGRLIRWDTGEEDYITGFTNDQNVTTQGSGTITSGEFTIWYVNDVALQNELGRITTYQTESGDNQTTESAGVITHKRTHLSDPFGSTQTARELGFSPDSTAGNNIFDRILLGSAVVLNSGDRLKVVSNFQFSQSPRTSATSNPTASGDWTTQLNGTAQIENYGIDTVDSDGSDSGGNLGGGNANFGLEPSTVSNCKLNVSTNTAAFSSYGSNPSLSGTDGHLTPSLSAYSSGSYTRNKEATFATNNVNIAIGGIWMGGFSETQASIRHKPTTPPTKANTHSLQVVFKNSWSRTLTN